MSGVLTDTASWSLLLGVALPWLVAVVNRPWWPAWAKRGVAIAASIVGGLLVCLSTGAFQDGSGTTIMGACLTVLIASQAVYGRLFSKSVRRVEVATSPKRPAEVQRHDYSDVDDTPGQHAER